MVCYLANACTCTTQAVYGSDQRTACVFLSIAEYCACERYRCNSAGVLTPARTLLGVAATLTLLLLLMCLL